MNKDKVRDLIKQVAIIPAIRVSSGTDAHFAAETVTRGGIPIVEISMAVAGAVDLISHLVKTNSKVVVGAGTVLNIDTAQRCLDAGAQFLTSLTFNPVIVEFAAKHNVAALPGAMTPTEIVTAWGAGADFVKVFPCAQIGGVPYIKSLHTSIPQIPLIAAGGIDQYTAANYILSGATAIGVGAELIPTEAIERRQTERILELARRFKQLVKDAREQIEAWKESVSVKNFTEEEKCEK